MTRSIRIGLVAIAGLLLVAPVGIARAQSYPARPIKLVVPFAPGGGSDSIARIVAQRVAQTIGQPIVVENRAGAGATIGGDAVAKSAPDGYTLLFATPGVQITNQYLMKKLPYDPVHDFSSVALVGWVPNVLVVHPSVPAKTVKELIELAKAKPNTLNFSSSGVGASSHLAGELFKSMAGIQITHVAYKGTGPSIQDLLAGTVQMAIDSINVLLPHIKSGGLRALAVSTPERNPALPDLPAIAETLPGFDATALVYVTAPAKTPRPIIDRVNREVSAALKSPEVRDRLLSLGFTAHASTPEELDARIKSETAKWKKVIESAGIKPE
jgi:tripartite-type tricarboxylate transporter receptor subunit TctC